ncbi:hypothetical protein [Brasilonema bromeliae]|uniref:Uncharacterized protein n=1 Tax=Brasilonema bromeliae SPC951 TaxID=385972 RepID=A0ABX1P7R7_9CYAN|nr:hypothetical protein [Brasilonema bromeliae]NMG20391.1 hypothetical protein [Brasilonema bromeliae SPC951]
MTPEALNTFVKAVPFRPFRITLVNGTTYDIRHPEMLLLTRRDAFLSVRDNPDGEFADRVIAIGLSVVASATQLDTPAPAQPQDSAA